MIKPFTMIGLILLLLAGTVALGYVLSRPEAPISTRNFVAPSAEPTAHDKTSLSVAPDFTAPILHPASQEMITLSEHRGRYVLLNFWASWCSPCLTEMPEFITLAKAHPDDITILALTIDSKQEKASAFVTDTYAEALGDANNMIFAWDEAARISQKKFGTFRIPESYLIDPEGQIIKKFAGPVIEEDINEIEAVIATSSEQKASAHRQSIP